MNETTAKICEEQVADLTIENAHRVTMIRKKGTDYPPVPFLFRRSIMECPITHTCMGIRKNGMNCIPGISKTGKP